MLEVSSQGQWRKMGGVNNGDGVYFRSGCGWFWRRLVWNKEEVKMGDLLKGILDWVNSINDDDDDDDVEIGYGDGETNEDAYMWGNQF